MKIVFLDVKAIGEDLDLSNYSCPTKYHLIQFCGPNEPGGIRTLDLRLRRPLLYPAELQTHNASP